MKTQPTPTSPKFQSAKEQTVEAKVWSTHELRQPAVVPYGRIWWLILSTSVVMTTIMITGLAWAIHRYPQSWLTHWLPTSTTVVEKTDTAASKTAVPAPVAQAARTLYGLAVDQGAQGIYAANHITGMSVPLSNDGWLATVGPALPAGSPQTVALPSLGQPQAISLTVRDPASPFIFLKTTALDQPPVTIAHLDVKTADGPTVWVVSQFLQQTVVTARHLLAGVPPTWLPADRQNRFWILDQAVPGPAGSAVLDQDGHFLGIVGQDTHVWLLSSIEPILSQLLQTSTIDRPWLGLSYLDQSRAVVVGQPTAAGLLIGAASGDSAVTVKSPADKAGLKAGDILLTFDGQPLRGDLFDILNRYHPGDKITVGYLRQGKSKEVTLSVGVLRP